MDDRVWDAMTFTKNRERLLSGDLAQRFLEEIVAEARSRGLTSDEHFSVDGTMVQAWASQKSSQEEGWSSSGRFRRRAREGFPGGEASQPDA
jgi:transposase